MSVQAISIEQLRRMENQEGLVIQGCGGDLQEWVDGINEMLIKDGVFKKGTSFQEAYSFKHDGLTCLLFPFNEKIEMNVRKLALWRVQTRQILGSTWFSDYVPNELGEFLPKEPEQFQQKPDCPLIGRDSNVFNLMGIAGRTLREHGISGELPGGAGAIQGLLYFRVSAHSLHGPADKARKSVRGAAYRQL